MSENMRCFIFCSSFTLGTRCGCNDRAFQRPSHTPAPSLELRKGGGKNPAAGGREGGAAGGRAIGQEPEGARPLTAYFLLDGATGFAHVLPGSNPARVECLFVEGVANGRAAFLARAFRTVAVVAVAFNLEVLLGRRLVVRRLVSCSTSWSCGPCGFPPQTSARAQRGRNMAASGLDHLKNDYRRRFCRPSRARDINTEQGQNVLEILQDCFEEKSLANDFSTDSIKSVLYSTPKIKDTCIQSPSKEKSHPKSVPVSSRQKEASLRFIVEPSEVTNRSVQAHEVHQRILATDVSSKNTSDSKKMSSRNINDHHSEADEEFYLSVGSPSVLLDAKTSVSQNLISSSAQKRETYTFENSVNMPPSSTEISLKTKKRLNFEDKVILRKIEIDNKVSDEVDKTSEGQERQPSGSSQNRMQDSEYEIQPQAKSFSTLFLETIKRKSESSPIVRHATTAVPHSCPPDDKELIEDEFIIDESDKSFASRSWITIPRKTGPLKQRITSPPAESTTLHQGRKSREKHHNISPKTLTNDKHSHKPHSVETSQPSDKTVLDTSNALTGEMVNNCRSTKYEMYSENAKKSSGSKRTIKQKQGRKFKAKLAKEQLDMGQSKDENMYTSHITQDKFQRNSDRNMEQCEEMGNDRASKKQMSPLGSKKSSTRKDKEESKKRHLSSESKDKLVPEEVTSTVTRSRRISRRPSNWWVVKSEESPVYSNSSIRNELTVHHDSRQKSAKKTNQSSKNIGKKTTPLKRQRTAPKGSPRVQKVLNAKGSGGIVGHDEISSCSQSEPLESDEADLAKKKNLDCSRSTGSSKNQDDIMTTQNVPLMPQTYGYTCKTPTESNLDSGEHKTSILEESGPSTLKNYLMSGKKNNDVDDEKVHGSLDDSRVKQSKVIPKNRIHHKLILPSNTPNVRRTKRIRLKPLEYWRGERIDYQGRPSGGFVVSGILSPDTVPSKRKAKENTGKVDKRANKKRICLDNNERKTSLKVNLDIPLGDPLQPTRVKDPETREIILMDLIKPRDTYQFFVKHGELKVYKTLDTPYFSTGKLILGPQEEKGKQHVGQDILVFYVNFGDLLCTLHETPYIISTGDSFYVPSGFGVHVKNMQDSCIGVPVAC
uniref:Centromere protein C n=1 Tax=Callithrix jacchus TaxID=9483 RepID=A0A5F4W2Z2_CALJA